MIGQLDRIIDHARPDWHARAACRTPRARQLAAAGRADWMPDRGRSAGAARDICADCPVRIDCLEWALDQGHWLQGLWGGLTRTQRRHLLDQRSSS